MIDDSQNRDGKKAGIVALVGRSNVGKSTLLNALIGTKVAITSPRPQTTRFPIQGVLHSEEGQIVFVDTPGLLAKARETLTRRMNEYVREALEGIDAVLYVVDPTREIGREEKWLLSLAAKARVPKILAINKIDLADAPFLVDYRMLASEFDDSCEISALKGRNLKELLRKIFAFLPKGEPLYPKFQLTNMETKQWMAELVREKIFLTTRQEVPYTAAVEIDEITERQNGIFHIQGRILTTDDRHQRMLIGAKGSMIKQIGRMARRELEAVMGKKVFLELEVEVDPRWAERLA